MSWQYIYTTLVLILVGFLLNPWQVAFWKADRLTKGGIVLQKVKWVKCVQLLILPAGIVFLHFTWHQCLTFLPASILKPNPRCGVLFFLFFAKITLCRFQRVQPVCVVRLQGKCIDIHQKPTRFVESLQLTVCRSFTQKGHIFELLEKICAYTKGDQFKPTLCLQIVHLMGRKHLKLLT